MLGSQPPMTLADLHLVLPPNALTKQQVNDERKRKKRVKRKKGKKGKDKKKVIEK